MYDCNEFLIATNDRLQYLVPDCNAWLLIKLCVYVFTVYFIFYSIRSVFMLVQ